MCIRDSLISHRQCCLSREVSKCVTVVTNESWREPGRASKCKPNFPRAGLPLKGSLKVCNCRHRRHMPRTGRANKCTPNFPRAGLPLKGGLKVCNCPHKGITVLTKETWEEPGRAGKCKPNFPRAGLPLKGGLKVCSCPHKRDLEAPRPRRQVQT